jgi:carnitine 3-dehydrogenase
MRHMLKQFGPCLKWPWTKLEAPELTESLIDKMVEGTQQQAGGRSIRELERLRDDYLVAIQQVLRQYNIGAGATLRALEERLYTSQAHDRAAVTAELAAWPPLSGSVRTEWIDYNGHMTDSRYQQVFGDAMDALYRRLGVDEAYRAAGHMFFTAETHNTHRAELKAGESYTVRSRVLGVDAKRLHVFHGLYRGRDQALAATGEQMHLHVDTTLHKTAPIPELLRTELQRLRAAQAHEAAPAQMGRSIAHL